MTIIFGGVGVHIFTEGATGKGASSIRGSIYGFFKHSRLRPCPEGLVVVSTGHVPIISHRHWVSVACSLVDQGDMLYVRVD